MGRSLTYKTYVAPEGTYDAIGFHQFMTLVRAGMRPCHTLLDIGCGSLCGGRYSLLYLEKGNYSGIEPAIWTIKEAMEQELGDMPTLRGATFYYFDNFKLSNLMLKYDYLMAHSIFSHADQDQVHLIMREAYKVMRPSSKFLATYISGPVDNIVKGWRYPVGHYYTHKFIEEAAISAGLKSNIVYSDDRHPVGHTWVEITRGN